MSRRLMIEPLEVRALLSLGLTPCGTWTQLAPSGAAPSARYCQTAVEDQAHDRMIIFGGESTLGNGGGLNDVWGGRQNASAVYDPSSNEMIIFGGDQTRGYNGGDANDTWVLTHADGLGGTPQWIQLNPAGTLPIPRRQAGAVYDVAHNRMIVVGGITTSAGIERLYDVCVLENANGLTGTPTWTEFSPGTVPPIVYAPVVYDPASNRLVMFDNSFDGDTWVLSNADGLGGTPAWTKLSTTGTPPSSQGFSAVYDPATNLMAVFGGGGQSGNYYNDVYTLSDANGLGGTPVWTQVNAGSSAPDPRHDHTAVYNPTSGIMTVFGGDDNSVMFGDVWAIAPGAVTAGGAEGATNSSVLSGATFTDANPGDHSADMTAVITWGDGGPTSAGTVSYDAGSGTYTVSDAHTYAEEGTYPISIAVNDDGGARATISGTATVADAYSVTAGRSTGSQVLATFTDGNPLASASDYTPTVNWGGAVIGTASVSVESVSQTPPASTSTWQVVGSAIYAAQGTYPISVTVHDVGGNTFTSSGKVEFDAGAALLTDTTPQKTYSAVEGSSTKTQVLATFSDANATAQPTSFTATVTWAGALVGTPTVSVQLVSRTKTLSKWKVLGSAIYADVGTYSATVLVQDAAGNVVQSVGKTQFKVADAPLRDATAAKTYNAVEGGSTGTQVLARFTDGDPAAPVSDFSGTINWGDGQTTPFTSADVSLAAGVFSVSLPAGHTYAEAGKYSVSVSVKDAGGSSLTSKKVKFNVAEAALTDVTVA
ncbi:MAG: kelch repeat-containing protein, partial [Thermoguttaceae bacterium]